MAARRLLQIPTRVGGSGTGVTPSFQRLLLLGGLLLALAAAGYFLLAEPEKNLAPSGSAEADRTDGAPEAGVISELAGEIERSSASEGESAAPELAHGGIGAAGAAEPKAWFRGSLRIVKGELPVPPRLEATVVPDGRNISGQVSVALDARELSFAIPADTVKASCRLHLPSFMIPVQVLGAAQLDSFDISFPAPADGVIIEVEVLPHAGVQFLHDPSGQPLAGAEAWTELRDGQGSSSTWDSRLDADGMLFFDFKHLADFDTANTITFSVARPPDVGSSSSPDFDTADLPLLPKPIVLRFASSKQLHFLVQDTRGKPIAGAVITVGGLGETEPSGADGKITALQSAPAAESLDIRANGFVSARLPVTPAAATEQLVVLTSASWIELVGHQVPPGGWAELDAEFKFDGRTDASALFGERFQPGRIRESAGGSSSSKNRTDLRFLIRTSFSPEGRVVLDGIYSDVPATVTVSFHGQTFLVQRVPLQPGDGAHRIELLPLPEFTPLRGIVVDASGAPLAGAHVRSSSGGNATGSAMSNAKGEFDLGVLPAGTTVQLGFTKAGYGRQQIEFTGRAGDAQSVGVVTLPAPQPAIVLLVTPDGVPYVPKAGTKGVGARPVLHFFDEILEPAAQGSGPGEWVFEDRPNGALRFVVLTVQGEELAEFSIVSPESRTLLRLDTAAMALLSAPG